MKIYIFLVALLFAMSGLQAQVTADRDVFSSLGLFSTSGSLSFASTIGEPVIGTTNSGTINFLNGFQIPEDGVVGIEISLGTTIEVNVFPNPVTDNISVQFEGMLTETIQIELFDAMGRVIPDWSIEVNSAGIFHRNVSSLSSGTYFLKMSQEDGQLLKALPIVKL